MHELHAWLKKACISGSYAEPGQLTPPLSVPDVSAPIGPSALLTTGGRNAGPRRNRFDASRPAALSSGVKSIRSLSITPLREKAGGLVGNGCVGDVFSPGTSVCGTGRSSIGKIGSAAPRLERKKKACLSIH